MEGVLAGEFAIHAERGGGEGVDDRSVHRGRETLRGNVADDVRWTARAQVGDHAGVHKLRGVVVPGWIQLYRSFCDAGFEG